VLLALILLALLLKRLGLLEEAHGKVISRLVTDVTLPAIFLLGTLIAIHYGGPKVSAAERARASLRYFQSPIFFAFAIGLALSVVTLPAVFVLL
jgi:predicted permease